MGKFENSNLHNRYSNWAWQIQYASKKYSGLYKSDIDRMWAEYDFGSGIIAIIDLKWQHMDDLITKTSAGVYDDLQAKGFPVYIVEVNKIFDSFKVTRWRGETIGEFDEFQYADWLVSLRK